MEKSLSPTVKRSAKQERERQVLLGMVRLYLKTGKPIGSQTLKEAGFGNLSSATIRNYFASLEKEGFLHQQHVSGGRAPTEAAYRLYAEECLDQTTPLPKEAEQTINTLRQGETKEIASYLQKSVETLSNLSNLAVFITAPRFDHDYISDLKVVPIDDDRCLCVLVTAFGMIQTEQMHLEKKMSLFTAKHIEDYFRWRLRGGDKPEEISPEEELLAQKFYNELMMRYIVSYSSFIDEEVYRTGFSKLLAYPEFLDSTVLANSLALFENAHSMRLLLRDCVKAKEIKFWIGHDLDTYSAATPSCSVIAVPYCINNRPIGAIGLLGPTRVPYQELFSLLRHFSEGISDALTRSIYKFQISYREPERGASYLEDEEHQMIKQSRLPLLEDKNADDTTGEHQ